jgi:hypothetical protein
MNKKSHHGNIDDQHQNFKRSWMEIDFVNRQRYERTRYDDGEPLRPTFQQPEANSLRQEESFVNEAANPETPDSIRVRATVF